MKMFAGVECYKAWHSVAFLDEAGRLVETLTISNSPEGFDEAIACASRLAQSVSWVLESVGSHGRTFAKYLLDRGASVFDVPPPSTKRCRKGAVKAGKPDARGTQAIAELVLEDVGERGSPLGERARGELRLYDDCRDRLVRDRAQALNRMRAAALLLGIAPLPKMLHRPQALDGLRAQLDQIEIRSTVSGALVTELRFEARTIEMLNDQIAEVERHVDPLVGHVFQELFSRSAAAAPACGHR